VARSVHGETGGDEKPDHDPLRNTQRFGAERSPTSRADKTWIELSDLLDYATPGRIHQRLVPNSNSRNGLVAPGHGSHEGCAR
jgi:hypothetical protein